MTLVNRRERPVAARACPFERVLAARVASAMGRVTVGIELCAREVLVDLGASNAAVQAAAEAYEQARLRCWLAEDAEREAIRRVEAARSNGAWPFDPVRWSAWLKLTLESEQAVVADGMFNEDAARQRIRAELSEIEQGRDEEASRCVARVLNGLMGIAPFDAVRFESTCVRAAAEAAIGCGQSDVLWARRVTSRLGALLQRVSGSDLDVAKRIAVEQGWMDADQEAAMDRMVTEAQLCQHGLEPACCPVGCGDL